MAVSKDTKYTTGVPQAHTDYDTFDIKKRWKMDITDVLGDFGFFQKRLFVISLVRSVALSGVAFLIHFATLNVDHWCAPEGDISPDDWKECCIPREKTGLSRCYRYLDIENQTTPLNGSQMECVTWQYADNGSHSSMISEFDLVCSNRWKVSLLFTAHTVGSFIGYFPSGYFADRYGRRPCIFFGLVTIACLTTISAFSTSPLMFGALRILSGICYPFLQHTTMSIYLEVAGKKQRTFTQYIYNGAWGFGLILQALFSLTVPNWRHFILKVTIPAQLIYSLLVYFYVPESPRWLLSSKKYDEAEKLIKKLAKLNRVTIVDMKSVMVSLKEKIEMEKTEQKLLGNGSSSFLSFFKSRRLFTIASILFFINAIKAFLGTGFSITLRHFGGIVHINFIVYGVTAILSGGVFELARMFFKLRRMVLGGCYAISGVVFIIIIFISDDLFWLKLCLAMTGNILRKVASASLFIVASEVFPTNLRGKGTAMYMMCGRFGSMLGALTDLLAYQHGRDAPLILFAAICVAICATLVFLPETQDKHLPDSVAEANKIAQASPRPEEKTNNSTS